MLIGATPRPHHSLLEHAASLNPPPPFSAPRKPRVSPDAVPVKKTTIVAPPRKTPLQLKRQGYIQNSLSFSSSLSCKPWRRDPRGQRPLRVMRPCHLGRRRGRTGLGWALFGVSFWLTDVLWSSVRSVLCSPPSFLGFCPSHSALCNWASLGFC